MCLCSVADLPPDLEDAIRTLMDENPDWAFPEGADGCCSEASYDLMDEVHRTLGAAAGVREIDYGVKWSEKFNNAVFQPTLGSHRADLPPVEAFAFYARAHKCARVYGGPHRLAH